MLYGAKSLEEMIKVLGNFRQRVQPFFCILLAAKGLLGKMCTKDFAFLD